ncbi:hypothetical protein [Nonomuraea sp. NPDC049400]|uniref:hypothetical protein n=1 Tax=Nonomuraea sp. NPDC049400 TaxID=3364352 RepID=UPI0037A46873
MSQQPDSIRIVNEFAEAYIRPVVHGNGTRLEVTAPRVGTVSTIDAVILEALAAVAPEDLTAILVATVPGNAPHVVGRNANGSAHLLNDNESAGEANPDA